MGPATTRRGERRRRGRGGKKERRKRRRRTDETGQRMAKGERSGTIWVAGDRLLFILVSPISFLISFDSPSSLLLVPHLTFSILILFFNFKEG